MWMGRLTGNATTMHLTSESARRVVDPGDPEAFLVFVDPNDALLAEVLDKLGERRPLRRIHVDVVLVLDVLLVDLVRPDALRVVPEPRSEAIP